MRPRCRSTDGCTRRSTFAVTITRDADILGELTTHTFLCTAHTTERAKLGDWLSFDAFPLRRLFGKAAA